MERLCAIAAFITNYNNLLGHEVGFLMRLLLDFLPGFVQTLDSWVRKALK